MSDAQEPHGRKRSKHEATSSDDDESGHEDKQLKTEETESSSCFDGFDSDEDAFDDRTFVPITKSKGKEKAKEESPGLIAEMEAAEAERAAKLA